MKKYFLMAGLACASTLPMMAFAADAQQAVKPPKATARYVLDKVVVVSRHGVRPQTDSAKLEKATGRKWPEFTVEDGQLSGHGYTGITLQAAYQLDQWKRAGLHIGNSCPRGTDLFAWSSASQRTRATAQAYLDGMFPGCGLRAGYKKGPDKDPIFKSAKMNLSVPDSAKARKEIMANIGSFGKVARHYQPYVDRLRAAVCGTKPGDCDFLNQQWSLEEPEPGKFKLKGPLSSGPNIGETIRLQYSEGLPIADVAFGNGRTPKDVAELSALHAAKYDLVSYTPELARHGGTVMMSQLVKALQTGTDHSSPKEALAKRIVLFVGHDTNIAQIKTMLDFGWKQGEYPAGDIPPGGSLTFERYYDKVTHRYFVRTSFSSMTMNQWRNLQRPTARNPMLTTDFNMRGCFKSDVGVLCPVDKMVNRMKSLEVKELRIPSRLYD